MRVAGGVAIDRSRPIRFSFDGRRMDGFAGDTLASALLANGVHLVGRSFKYHRPRGIVGLGAEEPNALVTLESGALSEPNSRATQIDLYDGLAAYSQNCWPSPRFDFGAINDRLSQLIPAGFYYKTFMWPARAWMTYEHFIRKAAGMGRVPHAADPESYDTAHARCDVLVVGAGPAGLSAALTAAQSGARVILADENAAPGGSLLNGSTLVGGESGGDWRDVVIGKLSGLPNITILMRSTVFGHYDHGFFGIAQRINDYLPPAMRRGPRQRLWKVHAETTVLATGAIERPLVFPDNDRPQIMLASAVRGYLHRYGVLCGREVVIATNNDHAYALVEELQRAGARIVAVIDARPSCGADLGAIERSGALHLLAHAIDRVIRGIGLQGVEVVPTRTVGESKSAAPRRFTADLVCVSGGWTPTIHLHTQAKGRTRFAPELDARVPDGAIDNALSAGGCNGTYATDACVHEGADVARACLAMLGLGRASQPHRKPPPIATGEAPAPRIHRGSHGKRCFVDFQNDVTVADIELAAREGYHSVEHVKRYTTWGMGTDQGKLSSFAGLAVLSEAVERPLDELGTTTYRPPYTPVTIGTLVGRSSVRMTHPVRHSPAHDCHVERATPMINAGLWKRPQVYPRAGETVEQAAIREVNMVRNGVGLADVSTLGKYEIHGPDAAELLDRLYTNGWKTLAVGRGRYGLMLREDGFVFDDGVTMRLDQDRFLMTVTTANADAVGEWIEFYLQTQWPDLRVHVFPVTEQWFAAALSGPRARDVLAKLMPALDAGNDSFPLMSIRQGEINGIEARVMRISFSGELSYEINVPSDYGHWLWEHVLDLGREFGIEPYGLESVGTMRIEKGHVVVGAEADGRTTPDDLGLGGMVSKSKDFIGKRSLTLPGLTGPERKQLVGLIVERPEDRLPVGAQLVEQKSLQANGSVGHVTSYAFSPTRGRHVALALLKGGRSRMGQTLYAASPLAGTVIPVTVTAPCFVDPEGARQRG